MSETRQNNSTSSLESLVRFLLNLMVKVFFRINVKGLENIPKNKGALLVCNHVSFLDGVILGVATDRPIRFIVDRSYYNRKFIRHFCRILRLIPISADDSPRAIIDSLREARSAMDHGEIVCIFAEGAITRNGMMQAFKGGFKRIMQGSDYSIIPTFIGGMWETVFSYYYEKPLAKFSSKIPYRLGVHFGKQIPGDSTAGQIRKKVSELSCDYFEGLKPLRRPLGVRFVGMARKRWFKRCLSDTTGKTLNYGKTLIAATILSELLKDKLKGQEKIGLILPASVGGALANIAVTFLGKVAVNLNFTASEMARTHAIKQCNIQTIITSKLFLKKLGGLEKLEGMIYLEDILKEVTAGLKIKSILKAIFAPKTNIAGIKNFNADTLATVIYSSGSSGMPKGVMLSHHNILSNIESLKMIVKIQKCDDICGILPLFHSFGYTVTIWLPVICGVSVSYAPNPLDPVAVGEIARKNKSTLLIGTPTFIATYTRRTPAEDFASLRLVVVGAEKLKRKIADAFDAKFNIKPYEGYGATELSPVAILNVPDFKAGDIYQKGNKEGAIGHPIPGVAVKVVDVNTDEELPLGQQGLLYVKGPNVMLGYLDMPAETAEAMQDGWYNTGDVVTQDANGFVTLTDRLSRFSKIGGEMIPHLAIEEIYMDVQEFGHQVIAVTSVPDDRKGEELVVLYLPEVKEHIDKLHAAIEASSIPNLWKPKRKNYFQIDQIPVLGSGKLDILRLRKLALEAKFGV